MTRTEVLVIGAGPAGIAAATAAAEHGRRVLVLDDNPHAGGQIWRSATARNVTPSADGHKARALDRLARSGAIVQAGRSVFAADARGSIQATWLNSGATQTEACEFERLILATGARERFLPFPGWTLPGVFGAGGLQALAQGGLPVAGKRVIVAGTGPLLLAVAAHLRQYGAAVAAVFEQAPLSQLAPFAASLWSHPGKLLQGASYRSKLLGTSYRTGTWIIEALPSTDGKSLTAVRITNGRRTWTEPCDLLAIGYHLVPNTEIASLLGCALQDGFVSVNADQRTSLNNVYAVGEPTGIAGLEAALIEGEIAGLACAHRPTRSLHTKAAKQRTFGQRLDRAFALRPELRQLPHADTIVCRCEDVPFDRIREHTGWTDAKLQSRCGMGPCQARICGPAVQFLLGWRPASVREPLYPVPLQALCTTGTPQLHQDELTKEKA